MKSLNSDDKGVCLKGCADCMVSNSTSDKIFKFLDLENGVCVNDDFLEKARVVFVLSGSVLVESNREKHVNVNSGYMTFIPKHSSMKVSAYETSRIVFFSYDFTLMSCSGDILYSLKSLSLNSDNISKRNEHKVGFPPPVFGLYN